MGEFLGLDPQDPNIGLFRASDGSTMRVPLSEAPSFADAARTAPAFVQQQPAARPPRVVSLGDDPFRISGSTAPPVTNVTPQAPSGDTSWLGDVRRLDGGPGASVVEDARFAGVPQFNAPEVTIQMEEPTMEAPPPGARGIDPSMNPFQQATLDYGRAEAQREQRQGPRPYQAPAAQQSAPQRSVTDLTGGAMAPRPQGSGGGVRRPAVTAPPTEGQINEAFVDALGQAPQGAFQAAFPQDYRGESLPQRENRMLDQARQLAQRQAHDAAVAAAQRQDAIAAAEEQRARIAAEREAALGQARQRYDDANRRVSETRVEPAKWFSDRGFGGQAAAAISVALGSFGQALGGGPNIAAQTIQEAVRSDIEAQRMNIANAREGAESLRGVYQMFREQYDDAEAAASATEAAMYAQIDQQVAQKAAELGSAEAAQQAEQLRLELDRARQAALADADRQQALRTLELRRALADTQRAEARAMRDQRRAMGVGGAPAPSAPNEQTMTAFNRAVDGGANPADAARIYRIPVELIPPSGRFPEATTGEQAGTIAALSTMLGGLEGLLPADPEADIAGIGMTGALPDIAVSESGRAIRQQVTAVTEMIGRLHSGGAISDDEFARFRMILGSDTDEGLRRGIGIIRSELGARGNRRIDGTTRSQDVEQTTARVGARPVSQ